MQKLVIPLLMCALAACSRAPTYEYGGTAKAVLINAVAPEAYYYSFGTYSYDQYAYPVEWDVPGLVESEVRAAAPVEFIDYVAPQWMVGTDMSGFETRMRSEGSSQIKATAAGICQDTGADALVILGTVAVDWSQGGTPRVSKGYGLMTRSGTTQRRFWAYSIPAAVTLNCQPLDFSRLSVAYRMPIEMRGFRPSLAVDRLTDAQRQQVKDAVLASLQQGQGGNEQPVKVLAKAVAAQFDPLADQVDNVTPSGSTANSKAKRGVW